MKQPGSVPPLQLLVQGGCRQGEQRGVWEQQERAEQCSEASFESSLLLWRWGAMTKLLGAAFSKAGDCWVWVSRFRGWGRLWISVHSLFCQQLSKESCEIASHSPLRNTGQMNCFAGKSKQWL